VGLNYANFLLVLKDAPDGTPRGIAPDLARELGKRLGVAVQFVRFNSAGLLADAVTDAKWDIAFLGSEPARADKIAFSPAYLEIPVTYLVPPGSTFQSPEEVDREGVRIAVAERSAYDLYLSRTLQHAELVHADNMDASYQLLVEAELEALAGLKPRLLQDAQKLPGSRVLDGQLTAVQQAIGTPNSREAGARYLREFAEDVKASGLVTELIERHQVPGVNVAPKA
jgi:polar amino acid transport system substrate-binding protein